MVAVVTLFTFLPMVGTMTSYSTVRALIQTKFNLSMTLSGLANSLAFGFTVGFSPISSSLFKKYGYKKLVLLGYGGGSLTLVVCGLLAGIQNSESLSIQGNVTETQNTTETRFLPVTGEPLVSIENSQNTGGSGGYMFVFLYSVVFGICNNFVYNGSISMTGKHLSGSDVLAPATVVLSLAVPLSGFLGNPLSQYMIDVFGEDSGVTCRFMVFGAACMFSTVVFYLTTEDPKNEDKVDQKNLDSQSDAERTSMMETKTNFEQLHELNATPSTEKNNTAGESVEKNTTQSSLDFKLLTQPQVLIWIFATALWGMLFTIPNTLGTDYMVNNFGLAKAEAASVLSSQGFVELVTRLLMVVIGKKLPKKVGSYALIYSVCCFLVGVNCVWVSFQVSKFAAWTYFLLLQPPVAIMNCLIYAATENIFGSARVESVWSFTNLLLAVGFTAGPIMCTFIMKFADMHQAVFVAGVLASVGSGLLAILFLKARKTIKGPDES